MAKQSGTESITINSIIASIHDTGYGGYPYKVTCTVSLPVKLFNKLGFKVMCMHGECYPSNFQSFSVGAV